MLLLGILGGLWVALLIIRMAGMPQRHREYMALVEQDRADRIADQIADQKERAAVIQERLAAPCPNPVWEPDYNEETKS